MTSTTSPASTRFGPAAVRVMLHRCGLSQTEAAHFLGVQDRTVRHWTKGDFSPGAQEWRRLEDLCALQDLTAERDIAEIRDKMRRFGKPEEIHIRLARTQEDAERLGMPCPSAHVAVLRRVMERAPKSWRIVPVYPGEDKAGDTAAERRMAN